MEDSAIKIAVGFNFWIGNKSHGTRPAVPDGDRAATGCNRVNKSVTKKNWLNRTRSYLLVSFCHDPFGG